MHIRSDSDTLLISSSSAVHKTCIFMDLNMLFLLGIMKKWLSWTGLK